MVTTADQREIDNFAALSDHWWDMRGPMAPLHAFTPIRIDYILANIERFWPKKARSAAPASRPLTGLRMLDIGCGGGRTCRSRPKPLYIGKHIIYSDRCECMQWGHRPARVPPFVRQGGKIINFSLICCRHHRTCPGALLSLFSAWN